MGKFDFLRNHHYSIFSFSEFLFRSDWTPVARGAACMKLHESNVSFSIRPTVFLAGGWADPPAAEHLYFTTLNYQRACYPAGATFSERSLGENLVP
jgi:hypothetical protein